MMIKRKDNQLACVQVRMNNTREVFDFFGHTIHLTLRYCDKNETDWTIKAGCSGTVLNGSFGDWIVRDETGRYTFYAQHLFQQTFELL